MTVYYSYTHALRHPVIIGHIAGWRLPWAVSATQLGAVAATTAVLLAARPVWAHFGGVGNLIFFSVVVGVVGWAVRFWRVEGRTPVRVAAGLATVTFGAGSRLGVYGSGRPVQTTRPVHGRGTQITVIGISDSGVGDG